MRIITPSLKKLCEKKIPTEGFWFRYIKKEEKANALPERTLEAPRDSRPPRSEDRARGSDIPVCVESQFTHLLSQVMGLALRDSPSRGVRGGRGFVPKEATERQAPQDLTLTPPTTAPGVKGDLSLGCA